MHFNNKYINQGDSQSGIKDKVNYNFNQVLSFAIGHEGYIGPKGATGIPGPSGKIGPTGNTGNRASNWYRGTVAPLTGASQDFDLWVDDSSPLGDIYERNSSAWIYSGLSLFNSDYFEVYSGIVGPLGLTNKSAIGFNPTYTPDQTSLVISDTYFSSLDVNPNNSKLLVATEDQINTPIFSFSKSNGTVVDFPSFYWKNTGVFSDLIFKSPGGLSINSLLDLEISSDDLMVGGSLILRGNSFSSITQGNLNLIGDNWIRLITDSSINPIIINSLNFGVNESKLYTKTLTKISWNVGDYALKSTPISGSTSNYFGGISVNSNSTTSRIFDFTGMDGHSVLYGLPLGSVSSGNHKQTVFGTSGGVSPGSTGAPYSYHVKRLNNISTVPQNFSFFYRYSSRNNNPFAFADFNIGPHSVLDLYSDLSYWSSNMLVVSSSVTTDQYILIPSSPTTSFEPLFYSGEGNEYRVYLNDIAVSGVVNKIKGIIFLYYRENPDGSILPIPCGIDFPSPCSYVDLFWSYIGSSTNPNGRIFWKTCSGSSGVLEVTNEFTITSNSAPQFPSLSGS